MEMDMDKEKEEEIGDKLHLVAILYRHIRLDKNEPFYIGIGKNVKRAYKKDNRNKFWKTIITKTDYEIEILFDDLTWEQACEKEKEFIKLYGRKDLGTGTLVNLTDGGEGTLNFKYSDEWKNKVSKRMKGKKTNLGNKHTEESKLLISIASKKRVMSDITKEKLSIALKGNKNNLGRKMSEETKNKISKANKGKKISENTKIALFNKLWKGYVYQLDLNDNIINKFKTSKEASEVTKINNSCIKNVIIGKRKTSGGFKWVRNYENKE